MYAKSKNLARKVRPPAWCNSKAFSEFIIVQIPTEINLQ